MSEDLLDELDRDSRPVKKSVVNLVFISLSMGAILIAVFIALAEIESIVATGPIVFILGAVTMVFAVRSRRSLVIIQSVMTIGIPILVFLVIAVGRLSPSAARRVLPYPLIAIALVHLIYSVICLVKESNNRK